MVNNKTRVLVVDDNQMVEQANAANKPSPAMDAIAMGVEAKLDPFSVYSKIVTRRTLEIAQQIGIAEEEVQQWAAARTKLDSKRDRVIRFESIWNCSSRDEPERNQKGKEQGGIMNFHTLS